MQLATCASCKLHIANLHVHLFICGSRALSGPGQYYVTTDSQTNGLITLYFYVIIRCYIHIYIYIHCIDHWFCEVMSGTMSCMLCFIYFLYYIGLFKIWRKGPLSNRRLLNKPKIILCLLIIEKAV